MTRGEGTALGVAARPGARPAPGARGRGAGGGGEPWGGGGNPGSQVTDGTVSVA